ncbi:FtsX-like permease family protein [Blastococcus sp. SYSU D00922]
MTSGRGGARPVLRRLRIGLLPLPGQALGLAVLVAVLAAALASVPLMTGSAEEGAWQRERARHAESSIGATFFSSSLPGSLELIDERVLNAAELDDAVVAAAADLALPRPVSLVRLRDPLFITTPSGPARLVLVSRAGAEEHLDLVAGGPGLLANSRLVDLVGLEPGGVLTADADSGSIAELAITGIYQDPAVPLDPYWGGVENLFIPPPDPGTKDPEFPTVALFAPRDVVLATADSVGEDVELEWYLPLPAGIGVDEARRTVDRVAQLQADLVAPRSAAVRITNLFGFDRPAPASELPDALERVDETVALLAPPVRAVGSGAAAAALVLVGAWAGQRVRRRDDELRSLLARGLPPHRAGGQALREALLPTLAGVGVGAAAGWLLVRALGPSASLPDAALPAALVALAAAGVASLLTVAVVTTALVTRLDSPARRPGVLFARIPWLPVTAAVTVVVAIPVLTGEADGGGIDLLQLVLPLLVTAVVAGGLTAALPRVPLRPARLAPAPFLALSRVLTGRAAARLVVITTALALGLIVYSGALADSTDRTLVAKQAVGTGSDVVVPLLRRTVEAGPPPDGTTIVGVGQRAQLSTGEEADVLVVRPEEIPAVTRWHPSFADQDVDQLMRALADHDGGGVPVVVAGSADADVGAELVVEFGRVYRVQVDVVGTATAFPGQPGRAPMVIADWDRFTGAVEAAGRDPETVLDRQLWARGDDAGLLDVLTASGYAFDLDQVRTTGDFAARPELSAQSWSFGYLRAVALAAGLLGLTGVAMHALAQQRRRTVAALLLTRMGMRRRHLDAAAALEIGLLSGIGVLVAVAVAVPASALVLRLLDPVPGLLPAPLFAVPWSSVAAVVLGVAVLSAATALLVGRAARSDDAGQVMRGAP